MAFPEWHLVVCGTNHRHATVAQREPLQIPRHLRGKANALFGRMRGVRESAIVSTCNRVEFYFVWDQCATPLDIVAAFYAELNGFEINDLRPNFYTKRGKHAAAHLFSVAAGLDSMVLGEDQILGQVREAYSSACAVKSAGKVIHNLFHQSFRVGKQVRTDTEMSRGACSVSSAAVALLRQELIDLDHPNILFVGVNQMITLAATSLRKLEFDRFFFANRTPEKAQGLADRFGGQGFGLDALVDLLAEVDVVITSTGSSQPVFDASLIQQVMERHPERFSRPARRLVFVDMAVPRDVHPEIVMDGKTALFDMQDIGEFIKDQQSKKILELPQAQEIVDRRLGEFGYWYDHIRYEPVYNGLGETFETVRVQEMDHVIENLPTALRDMVEDASCRLTDRLLHLAIRTRDKK